MRVDCVSDLHGFFPRLEGGDLLIVAGDLTARDDDEEYTAFEKWFKDQRYTKKIFIGGNHDNQLQNETFPLWIDGWSEYLCDSGTEFEGLKIWGSPWTPLFKGVNPSCKAFMLPETELEAKFAIIPEDVDILVTHGPPYGILDGAFRDDGKVEHVGSRSLYNHFYSERITPQLHVFGHVHEGYGHIPKMLDMPAMQFVNASHVDWRYKPVNKPIRILL